MFDQLTQKLSRTFDRIRGYGNLNESNIDESLREVRLSLLEADVNFRVVKDFTDSVKQRALGQEALKSLTPGQHFVKIVHEELKKILGEDTQLSFAFKPPVVIMLVGLQGSGKTTTAAKLALYCKNKLKRNPYLVPCDVYRPAAIDQLKTLGASLNIPVYPTKEKADPVKVAREARLYCEEYGFDVVIIDTAGRLHIDDTLMKELSRMKEKTSPHHVLFVADAMTGQEAVNVSQKFNENIPIDGVVLTKMDGDARGGAALSLRYVLKKPIYFIGVGEKASDLEAFYPERMASRVLGMGDVLSLIEQAQDKIDLEKAKEVSQRVLKQGFSLIDFQEQLKQMKKLGSLDKVASLIPGVSKVKDQVNFDEMEKDLKKKSAIINSMTLQERYNYKILTGSRRLRIAKGSGTQVSDVNRLIKEFEQMKKMIDKFGKFGMKGMGQMAAMMRGGFG